MDVDSQNSLNADARIVSLDSTKDQATTELEPIVHKSSYDVANSGVHNNDEQPAIRRSVKRSVSIRERQGRE